MEPLKISQFPRHFDDIPESNGLIKALLQPTPIATPQRRSLDLHYESGNFQKSYPVPTS